MKKKICMEVKHISNISTQMTLKAITEYLYRKVELYRIIKNIKLRQLCID